jgi:hypothetical protein
VGWARDRISKFSDEGKTEQEGRGSRWPDLDAKMGIGADPQEAIDFMGNMYNSFTRLACP